MVFNDNLKGWDGVGGGRFKREGTYVYLWLIHDDVRQKPSQHFKAIILQLKINKFFKIMKKNKGHDQIMHHKKNRNRNGK